MSNDTILKSSRWTRGDTGRVFNELVRLYEESNLEPSKNNHKEYIQRALDNVLDESKHKDVHYLAGRASLSKKKVARQLYVNLRAVTHPSGRPAKVKPKISDLVGESPYESLIKSFQHIQMEQLIAGQIKTKLDEIFTPDFKAQVRQAVLTNVSNPQAITGFISGTFSGTFTPEKTKIQPLAPIPAVQAITTTVTVKEEEPEVKVIHSSEEVPPIEKNEQSDLLKVAVTGFDPKYYDEVRKYANHIHRMIQIDFYTQPGKVITVHRLPANYDHVFIIKCEGIGAAEESRLLANGYYVHRNFTIIKNMSVKDLGKLIADWSIEERKRNEGTLQ